MRKLAVLLLLFGSLVAAPLGLAGCRPKAHERLKVAVSIFPIYDLVRRIAGPDADVLLVLAPGTAPAGWVPTPEAKDRVAGARLLVSIGLGLDPWMESLAPAASPKARKLELGNRVPTITGDDGAIDPHVWMDPQRARMMTMAIAEDLARTDSSHAGAFRDRAAALDASLAALDHETEGRVASWRGRSFTAAPPDLGYYAERYGLHEVGAAALSAAHDSLPPAVSLDALGGANATSATYEYLIRFDTAALESALR